MANKYVIPCTFRETGMFLSVAEDGKTVMPVRHPLEALGFVTRSDAMQWLSAVQGQVVELGVTGLPESKESVPLRIKKYRFVQPSKMEHLAERVFVSLSLQTKDIGAAA